MERKGALSMMDIHRLPRDGFISRESPPTRAISASKFFVVKVGDLLKGSQNPTGG